MKQYSLFERLDWPLVDKTLYIKQFLTNVQNVGEAELFTCSGKKCYRKSLKLACEAYVEHRLYIMYTDKILLLS